MTPSFLELLQTGKPILLDGALATELEQRGADLRDPLWSARLLLENPALIQAVHLDYYRAGAQVATTASYQASLPGFAARGYSHEQAIALIQLSVQLAQSARAEFQAENKHTRPLFVAGSVGPYGAYLANGAEYRGNYGISSAELQDFHRPRLQALLSAGVDFLACETIPGLQEVHALLEVLREFPQASAWLSFSARDEAHTCEGDLVSDCARLLDGAPQIFAIGINCTAPQYIPGLIANLRQGSAKPIVVYPNSGEVYDPLQKAWRGAQCQDFAAQAGEWLAGGAQLIGGCCRTSPQFIHSLRELFEQAS